MKKLIVLLMLSLPLAAPAFAVTNVVGGTAKIVGKDSYKAARTSVKEAGHVGKSVLKFLF
jgi:hypothetical protein